ncbi:putative hydro-lyase [Sulfobacillus thermosulfidooxidans]|uniref:putative hydro-lyase n=1 Tax=Sulfobacillus thermosulfidooxidans TaxID=28034 RepID=UPI0006B57CFB|nr:putative hydro-lyase [Sulfobacillus thermosulfidooxidans]
MDLASLTAVEARDLIRKGSFNGPTSGMALGYVQANLVILPKHLADDFYEFCQKNPAPMPVLDRCEPGDFIPRTVAPTADLRTDLPRYRVYRKGVCTEEPTDLRAIWADDFVAFVLGCSFTTEQQLLHHGVRLRHLEQGRNVPMFKTSILCQPSHDFHGPLVVSMRPIAKDQVARAQDITSHYPLAHGAPVHIGDPAALGIWDLSHPDYGDGIELKDDEVPVFWACGVTPQAVIEQIKPDIAITHAPGHMFITDLRDDDIRDCEFMALG